jgi:hypothetical protein
MRIWGGHSSIKQNNALQKSSSSGLIKASLQELESKKITGLASEEFSYQ